MEQGLVAWIPLLPLLGAVILALGNRRFSRVVAGGIASTAVGGAAVLSFVLIAQLIGHGEDAGGEGTPFALATTVYRWIEVGHLHADIGFSFDALSGVMACVITGVGFLIHVYSIGYMDDPADAQSTWRFFAYLNLFVFAMLLLVLGDNFLLMFVGWEGVGLCSYLLIGFWFDKVAYANAGMKAFVTNRVGDFSFILGLFCLFWSLGGQATVNFAELREVLVAHPELVGGVGSCLVTCVALLLFGGATGKSAQIPLFVWLPDAMAGPTPVSALIHAATMVTSGIYMICRLNFLFAMAPVAMGVVACIGAATALFAATIALTQTDIKKVLAYSTVSQLGYMFLGVGIGGFTAGFFHVLTHAFFKALLFLGSGSIIHALHHEQDMRKMGGLRKLMPVTFATFALGYLAIIGVPGFSGFFSKDEILYLAWCTPPEQLGLPFFPLPKLLWAVCVVTAGLTAFYMTRLMVMTFFGSYRGDTSAHGHDAHEGGHHHQPHESPALLVGPLVVLAILSVFGGVLNLPHWMPNAGWMHHFQESIFSAANVHFDEQPSSVEFGLMGMTLAVIASGVGAAVYLYAFNLALPAKIAERLAGLYKGSLNKWYVDELYELAIIGPIVLGSRQVLHAVVDVSGIDGFINGLAKGATAVASWYSQRVQVGRLQGYLLGVAIGAAAVVVAFTVGL